MRRLSQLTATKRVEVIAALLTGDSLRAAVRRTGVSRNIVSALLVDIGSACRQFLDSHLRGLPCTQATSGGLSLFRVPQLRTHDDFRACRDAGHGHGAHGSRLGASKLRGVVRAYVPGRVTWAMPWHANDATGDQPRSRRMMLPMASDPEKTALSGITCPSLYAPRASRPTEAMQPHWAQSGFPPY